MVQSDMDFWMVFCGRKNCSFGITEIIDSSSCANHALVISATILIIWIILTLSFRRRRTPSTTIQRCPVFPSILRVSCLVFNGAVVLAYIAVGLWTIAKKGVIPLDSWLVVLFQGLMWLLLCLFLTRMKIQGLKLCSFVALLSGFLCITSLLDLISGKFMSPEAFINVLTFPGAVLLVLYAFQVKNVGNFQAENGFNYEPLKGGEEGEENVVITPFAQAGFLSKMSFSWLNPLLKQGKTKTLQGEDIPELRAKDRAETCYSSFVEEQHRSNQTSILSAIISCQKKDIFVSGFFALVKITTLSSGPLFLYAFIDLAGGKEIFKHEGYALTAGLFVAKCLESVAERQWFFRTRLIGLRVQSLLTAAIYEKQLRLSSTSRHIHSPGEIMNYVTVDAYKIAEFPYFFHQIWTTGLQLLMALAIMYYVVGFATAPALLVIILSMLGNLPVAKLQHKFLNQLMAAQDKMLKAVTEALTNVKVLKFYAWEMHFKKKIGFFRMEEYKWLRKIQAQKGYYMVLFWSTPIIVSAVTFWACYLLNVPLSPSNVFTFLATLRIVQEPIRSIPEVLGVFIEAKVSFSRIVEFLKAPELLERRQKRKGEEWLGFKGLTKHSVVINSEKICWDGDCLNPCLENIKIEVKFGEKVAICGEVGSGKSTLLAAILGEVPYNDGSVEVNGRIAYVSQSAWIQTGTIRQNILFGSAMDEHKYQQVLHKCCLLKDIEMLPFGDQTIIGERGVNLSGGQKQRVQLARALYQEADIYLLDDPFSALDAHTASILFNEYVMGALFEKTVLLITHQVDFLPVFDSILLMSQGKILKAATYNELLHSSEEFQNLVHSHGKASKTEMNDHQKIHKIHDIIERKNINSEENQPEIPQAGDDDQLIKEEERESGYTWLKPYLQYLRHNKGFLYFSLAMASHLKYMVGQLFQNLWLASSLEDSNRSDLQIVAVYTVIGCAMALSLLLRSYVTVVLGLEASKSIFSEFMTSVFRAPMCFFDATPIGRILSRVSSDLSMVDLELSVKISMALSSTLTTYFSLGILATVTWPSLFVIIPTVFVTILLQLFYFASVKELIRIHGTNKSSVASFLSESMAGAMTIRAFGQEDRFFSESLKLIDKNGSSFFHGFSANEWLIQRLEILCAIILSSSALALTLLPFGASESGYIGMALSYALSLNIYLVGSVSSQCMLENSIISVERLEQYMHIPSEAPEIVQSNRPPLHWPDAGKLEIQDLKVKYRQNSPLVLQGITCTFEGGYKVGIVGRTGSGKSTLISALFRLVEPTEGAILIDSLNISKIGIHDLRSSLSIIPQDPTLFGGSIRYNLDPLSDHSDQEIWEVLRKCQLQYVVQKKEQGLDSLVTQDGSNWSMGQRQLFCLGRALLKRRKILILDEATASIDNATDSLIQKTIRTEFADCTVITVAHRIPTVLDCTMVLALRDGKVVEYDKPIKLINEDGSLFGQLVREYWLRSRDDN